VNKNYKADFDIANLELAELLDDRERLDIRIAKKRYRVAALLALSEGSEEVDARLGAALGGLTDAVITAFRSAHPKALTPIDVRLRLKSLGFPVEHYKNALAAIHTVVSRLFDARRIVAAKTEWGETGFKYQPKFGDPPVTLDT